MSNYPPGVSGFEPQIAGYPEREETREVGECTNVGRYNPDIEGYCEFAGGSVAGTLVGDPRDPECTFYWDCPECGTENETTIDGSEFEPDPDALRDAMMEG